MKDIGYYPKGPIHYHKALATGAPLPKADTRNLDRTAGRSGKNGTIYKSGTSTGGKTSK